MTMILGISNFTSNRIEKKFFKKIIQVGLKELGLKDDSVEISLVIVGPGRMRKLNKFYRGRNRVTDVLAFSFEEKGQSEFIQPPAKTKQLGEIVLCLSRAKKQARQLGHSLKKELTILIVHGLLHLLGYNHQKETEAQKMKKRERKILELLNFN